jgi:hypothetical protein
MSERKTLWVIILFLSFMLADATRMIIAYLSLGTWAEEYGLAIFQYYRTSITTLAVVYIILIRYKFLRKRFDRAAD